MGPRRAVVIRIFFGAFVLFMLVFARPALMHARAAGVLLRLVDGGDTMGLREFRTVPVVRTRTTVGDGARPFPAYLYAPRAGLSADGVVLVHGVHYRGIDEPRLVRFAESLATTGMTVLTPAVESLEDYRVDQAAITEIGVAAHDLRERLGGARRVGVIGISFAGGLALLAAADSKVGTDIGYVVTVGAYDDLARVSRFYATGHIERPDGEVITQKPHDYGPVVWVYAHLADFFPAGDVEDARVALRFWLHEERDLARAGAATLPDASRAKLLAIFEGHIAQAFPDLAADVDRHAAELAALSPHGHLDGIHVAVFALHGSDDSLIPASETLWLAHDLPPGMLAHALISRALTHVEIGHGASFAERWQAVHFMAGVLAEAHNPAP